MRLDCYTMSARRLIPALALTLLLGVSGPAARAAGPDYVLPPPAAQQLVRMLGLDGPSPDGLQLQVAIDKDRAHITASRDGAEVATLTLVHPSKAPADALRVAGFAVLPSEDPGEAGAREALLARLRAAGREVTWTELRPPPAPADPAEQDRTHRQIDVALYQVARGRPEQARQTLAALPGDLPTGTAVRLAMAWRIAGDQDRAEATLAALTDMDPAQKLAAAAIRGAEDLDVEASLEGGSPRDICDRVAVSDILARLDLAEPAMRLARAARAKNPDCPRAWEAELHRLLEAERLDDAAALAREAVARLPGDDQLTSLAASALSAHGDYREAVPLLEAVARRHPEQEGVMRVLLSAMLRDTAWRETYRDALRAKLAANPDDVLAQFLLGIIAHYENRFAESNALLEPIEPQMGHQSRFHIYRAMNDFNLGKVDEALARLDAAAEKPLPDPDVFYCRAEILRDTRRAQALDDLRRYRVNPEGATLSNPAKEARVERMMRDLEACLADGRPKCESEWEHPRLTHGEAIPGSVEPPAPPPAPAVEHDPLPWVFGGALLAALAGLVLHLRRRRG